MYVVRLHFLYLVQLYRLILLFSLAPHSDLLTVGAGKTALLQMGVSWAVINLQQSASVCSTHTTKYVYFGLILIDGVPCP